MAVVTQAMDTVNHIYMVEGVLQTASNVESVIQPGRYLYYVTLGSGKKLVIQYDLADDAQRQELEE